MNTQHPTFGNGKICYLQIPSLDITTSAGFYQQVFGWTIRSRADGSVSFDDGVGEVSGEWVLDREPAVYPGMAISIMVNDIEVTMNLIEQLGGEILSTETAGGHNMASFKDPSGNIMGLYEHKTSA